MILPDAPSPRIFWRQLVMLGVAVGLFTVVFNALIVLWTSRPSAVPIRFTAETYMPEQSVVCPGDYLIYTPTLQVAADDDIVVRRSIREPSPLGGYRTVYNFSSDDDGYFSVTAGDVIERRRETLIPELAPGEYRLIVSTTRVSGEGTPIRYSVPFTVPISVLDGCEG